MKRFLSSFAILCLLTAAVQAEPSDKEKLIRGSLDALLKSLDEPTITTASDMFKGDGDEFKLVQGYYDLNHATIDTMAALKKKFPEEMAKSKLEGDGSLVKSLITRMQASTIFISKDTAIIGRVKVGVTLQEYDGIWKVTSLLNDAQTRDQLIAKFKVTADLSHDFIKEIESGKYATANEAQKTFSKRVKDATDALKTATTKPAN